MSWRRRRWRDVGGLTKRENHSNWVDLGRDWVGLGRAAFWRGSLQACSSPHPWRGQCNSPGTPSTPTTPHPAGVQCAWRKGGRGRKDQACVPLPHNYHIGAIVCMCVCVRACRCVCACACL